jgi:hypothetical protein
MPKGLVDMRNFFGPDLDVLRAARTRSTTSTGNGTKPASSSLSQPIAQGSSGPRGRRRTRRRCSALAAAAVLVITSGALLSAPASAQSPTDVLSQLEADVDTAVAAAKVGGTDPASFYAQIATYAKQLLPYINTGPSPCRTSLALIQRLHSELANKAKLNTDVLQAQSGLLNCGVLIKKGSPVPVTASTTPGLEVPSGVVESFSETVKTKTKGANFQGTEVDHRTFTGEPRAGDAASCTKSECDVQLDADTKRTSDINASNSFGPTCNYSHLFASSVSNDGIAALVLHYNQDGKLTTAKLQYGPMVNLGIAPTEAGGRFLWSCIFLGGQLAPIEKTFEDKSVNAALLAEGSSVNVAISQSGSVAGNGFSGNTSGHVYPKPLSGTLSYTVTTRITFRLTH